MKLVDNVVGIVDMVGVRVRAQVERQVRGGDAVAPHIPEDPLGVTLARVFDSIPPRVAWVGAVWRAETFAAVDHGEDTARFEEDRIRCPLRREEVDARRPARAGEGQDLGAAPFLRPLLGRGRGCVRGISVAGTRLVHGSRAALGFLLGS